MTTWCLNSRVRIIYHYPRAFFGGIFIWSYRLRHSLIVNEWLSCEAEQGILKYALTIYECTFEGTKSTQADTQIHSLTITNSFHQSTVTNSHK